MSSSAQPDPTPSSAGLARNLMVDGQLRPSRVTDRRILDAMRRIPREAYLPSGLAGLAYIDDHVPLGGGRAMLKPLSLARLLQLARPTAGEAALIVGSGTGYGAAILAACGVHVTALESDPALRALARAAPVDPDRTGTVTLVEGPLADGHPAGAPYDLVVIEGAVRDIPDIIGAQVGAHGRLVAIVCAPGGAGTAVLAEPSVGGLRAQAAFDASAPLLAELVRAPAFTF
jgi:protein-L-isoaspartate(D-aspartate) O-methyltransferase